MDSSGQHVREHPFQHAWIRYSLELDYLFRADAPNFKEMRPTPRRLAVACWTIAGRAFGYRVREGVRNARAWEYHYSTTLRVQESASMCGRRVVYQDGSLHKWRTTWHQLISALEELA